MNPYTYTKGPGLPSPAQPSGLLGSGLAFVKEIFLSEVHGVLAVAFIALASVSLGAITAVASTEISASAYQPDTIPHHTTFAVAAVNVDSEQFVLGAQTYQIITLASSSALTLTLTPADVDASSSLWSYEIDWNRAANKAGSITIDKTLIVNDASGSGSITTDNIFKSGTRHRLVYFTQAGGKGSVVVSKLFTVLPATALNGPDDNFHDISNPANTHPIGTIVTDQGSLFLIVPGGKLAVPQAGQFSAWAANAPAASSGDQALPVVGMVVPARPQSANNPQGQGNASASGTPPTMHRPGQQSPMGPGNDSASSSPGAPSNFQGGFPPPAMGHASGTPPNGQF